ncbi:hypothetical protein [[Ruminococcus] torques]|uniref:hypothetical protein n=1 Tax=[Ruminococcus] torques TaxID=33039 RepID=UPI00242FD801|nr:hypothetical protein [[Ruminococcus] torques]
MVRIKRKAELSKEEKRRREIFESILCIMMVIFIITQIMLPETGVLGMVNEGSLSILFLGYGGSFLWSGMKRRKEDKTAVILGVLMSILLFAVGGWMSSKIAADLISGPKTIHLTSVTTEESFGLSGIISHHYYLCGRDENWEEYQFDISADEYYELEGEKQIKVLCYPRTERILKFL